MITRDDVARLANVSPAVVSYVLNSSNYVSKEKREAVLKAVEELKYIPNQTARSLKQNKTYQIAILRGSALNDMFNDLLYEMEGLAYEKGYTVSLMTIIRDNDLIAKESYIDTLISRKFDAIYVANSSLAEKQINRLVSAGVPVLLYTTRDYIGLDENIRFLAPDYRNGVYQLIDMLIRLGHSRIAFIPNPLYPSVSEISNHRLDGYLKAFKSNGLEVHPEYICSENDTIAQVLNNIDHLFDWKTFKHPPTAIYVDESVIAGSILQHLRHIGKAVPEDVSLVSSSDSTIATLLQPRLTAVGLNPRLLAEKAIAMLLELMDGNYPESCLMKMDLRWRESVKDIREINE